MKQALENFDKETKLGSNHLTLAIFQHTQYSFDARWDQIATK
jgi:hypothetical protein